MYENCHFTFLSNFNKCCYLLLNLYISSIVLILSPCGVCWYRFVFDLRLLTHSCVFLWIVDETMLLTISVKWLMWHSAISRAKWIEGKQIYKWWGKLLVWKSKTNVQFTLAITQTPLSEYRTYCIYMREECPSSKVTCICWHIHTIFRLGIFWSTCILVILALFYGSIENINFNSNYRSAWSLLKISPEKSIPF